MLRCQGFQGRNKSFCAGAKHVVRGGDRLYLLGWLLDLLYCGLGKSNLNVFGRDMYRRTQRHID